MSAERLYRWDKPWRTAAVKRCKFIRNRYDWHPVRAHLEERRIVGEEHPARRASFLWIAR